MTSSKQRCAAANSRRCSSVIGQTRSLTILLIGGNVSIVTEQQLHQSTTTTTTTTTTMTYFMIGRFGSSFQFSPVSLFSYFLCHPSRNSYLCHHFISGYACSFYVTNLSTLHYIMDYSSLSSQCTVLVL